MTEKLTTAQVLAAHARLEASAEMKLICKTLLKLPKVPENWLIDGSKFKPDHELWSYLNWRESWVDFGPSIAGNVGPYWHVSVKPKHRTEWGHAHRLYPRGKLANKARAITRTYLFALSAASGRAPTNKEE